MIMLASKEFTTRISFITLVILILVGLTTPPLAKAAVCSSIDTWITDFRQGKTDLKSFETIRTCLYNVPNGNSPTQTPEPTASPSPITLTPTAPPIKSEIKVLLINVNPQLVSENKTLTEKYQLTHPKNIANEVINRLKPYISLTIAETIESNKFPAILGQENTNYEPVIVGCLDNISAENPNCHPTGTSWRVDYNKFFDEFDICNKVNRDQVDEVWVGVYPYSGFGEDDMVGPNPFYINGMTTVNAKCNRNVPILGIDYNYPGRGNPNIASGATATIHSLGHRIESTMSYVYGSWNTRPYTGSRNQSPVHNWDIFAYSASGGSNSEILYGCGNTHFPPNGTKDYDYENRTPVQAICDSFLNYPNITRDQGHAKTTSCTTWDCTEQGYHQWWLVHLPHSPGKAPDGKLNSWVAYTFNPAQAIIDSSSRFISQSDINGNGFVTKEDFNLLKTKAIDINGDNVYNAIDISTMILHQGITLDNLEPTYVPENYYRTP